MTTQQTGLVPSRERAYHGVRECAHHRGEDLQGTLYECLYLAKGFHSRGIRTGLTRLQKGLWELQPRGVTA